MGTTKTAEKSEKTSTKPAGSGNAKVFDVSHPGKSVPSSSARPVIVSNRPILQDPMMASATPSEPVLSTKPLDKIVIKPLTADTEPAAVEAQRSAAKEAATEEPAEAALVVDAATNEVAATEVKVTPDSEKSDKPAGKDTGEKAPEAATSKPAEATEGTPDEAAAPQPNEESSKAAAAPAKETDEEITGTPAEDGANNDAPDEKEVAELEAKAKQEEEINKLVEAKDYFLPINAVERHRSKVISTLGLILIVILALVLVDIMMDSGILHIPGVAPVTHFFSA